MLGNPMNIPPVSIATAKAALIEQCQHTTLRRRATMLWGTRGGGKSSIVRQVAAHFGVPLVDLRLTTIEPVDTCGAIRADEVQGKTLRFPPDFLPTLDQPAGMLFLDALTAADQRLQISAYALILHRKMGHDQLPDGWQVVAAGNASCHGAVCHDMGTALADRMVYFNVPTVIEAWLAHAVAQGVAPEVMAFLQVRPDKLDDTQAQLAADPLAGTSPRGWEDVSQLLQPGLSEAARRVFVQGRIGAASAATFFGVLRELQAGATVLQLLAARPGADTLALLPRTLDGLYGLVYGLLTAATHAATHAATDAAAPARALEVLAQLPEICGNVPLPLREAQTLAMELLPQKTLEQGLTPAVLDNPAYRRDAQQRQRDGLAEARSA